ncbi:MAG TPA: Flp pilus assembly protein CpaB [Gemmatimonadota bacterium]|nr:Flp pilus assembly protein CpaB [Gemmatimonadota bacterium]
MRRKRRKWMALVLALVSGGAAGYLALGYMNKPLSPRSASASATTQIVVAARDLALGTVLAPGDVKTIAWPSVTVPPGYAGSEEQVVGRGLITPVSANEPLMTAKLADKEAGGGLPIVIPEGMRAVSVKVDEVIGVAGFVLPGTRVDVLVTLSDNSGREEAATRVILQNVRTLASGQTIQKNANGEPQTATVITLLVTPEEAEKLTLAATEGAIQLALRNTLDMAEVETDGIQTTTLVRTEAAPQPASRPTARGPRRPSGTSVITYNGAERTVTTF